MSFSSPILKQVVIVSGATVGTICIAVLALSVFSYQFGRTYDGVLYPNISINGIEVGGLTPTNAQIRLDKIILVALEQGITFRVQETPIVLSSERLTLASLPLLSYDTMNTVERAYRMGRSGSFFSQAFTRFKLLKNNQNIPLEYTMRSEEIKNALVSATSVFLPRAQDAQLVITTQNATTSVQVQSERDGQEINWDATKRALEKEVASLRFHPVPVPLRTQTPRWKSADMTALVPQAETWLSHAPFVMTAEGKRWNVTPAMLGSWIETTTTENGIALELSGPRMRQTFDDWLKGTIQPAKDGLLELDENNKLKIFVAPEEGLAVDLNQTRATIFEGWTNNATTSPITLVRVSPKVQGTDAERLGIREVLGVGKSNFSGSPTNRRYNIKLGAQRVHGSLVAPEGEFSLIKTLGRIDGKNGWLPELVIKGNKTTPEFGGGLCQIGTTTFRGALNSGLPITERRSHSYRVRYYEPAGTDATIYEPSPDFKFKNDTGNWILITTKITGDNVAFTFWGTSDKRIVDLKKPVVSHITPAPPKKIIETTDLAPGKVKCTESAHAGATAKLDYNVTYANGETKKVTFTSVYRPWGAVCLVGAASPAPTSGEAVDQTGINNPN